jgi:NitT/TauT family transport system substrate-binding protein
VPVLLSSVRRCGRRPMAALAAGLGVVALVGCGDDDAGKAASSSSPKGLERTSVTILAPPHANGAPLWIAQQKGYFKQQGLDVKIEPPTSPAAALPALAAGKVDLLYVSIQPGVTAIANGQKLSLVEQGSVGTPHTVGIVTKDPDIRSPADLPGKKVAVQVQGATCDLGAKAALKAQGVDGSKVKWVELPLASHAPALERGDVDAVCAVEPTMTQLKQQEGARLVVDSMTGDFAKLPADGYWARTDFATKNPKTVAAFRRGLELGVRAAKADEAALRKTIVGYTKMPPKIVDAMTLPTYVTGVDPAQIQRVLDTMKAAGVLTKAVTADQVVAKA